MPIDPWIPLAGRPLQLPSINEQLHVREYARQMQVRNQIMQLNSTPGMTTQDGLYTNQGLMALGSIDPATRDETVRNQAQIMAQRSLEYHRTMDEQRKQIEESQEIEKQANLSAIAAWNNTKGSDEEKTKAAVKARNGYKQKYIDDGRSKALGWKDQNTQQDFSRPFSYHDAILQAMGPEKGMEEIRYRGDIEKEKKKREQASKKVMEYTSPKVEGISLADAHPSLNKTIVAGIAPQEEPFQTQELEPEKQHVEPPEPFETPLSPSEEAEFQKWKKQYAPNDSGEDYDLRGAFKAGLKPDPKTGHWPDTFKKPNHPTFSNESKYANDAPEKAGQWEGDKFVPPAGKEVARPRSEASATEQPTEPKTTVAGLYAKAEQLEQMADEAESGKRQKELREEANRQRQRAEGLERSIIAERRADQADEREKRIAAAKDKGSIRPEDAEFVARQVWAGDRTAMMGWARNQESKALIQKAITDYGRKIGKTPEELTAKEAEFKAIEQAERSIGARAGAVELGVQTVKKFAPLVAQASAELKRTNVRSLNDLYNAVLSRTSSPELRRLSAQINGFINMYARTVGGGTPHVDDKLHAREVLDKGFSHGDIMAALEALVSEMEAEQSAVPEAIHEITGPVRGRSGASTGVSSGPSPRGRGEVDYTSPKVEKMKEKVGPLTNEERKRLEELRKKYGR